MNRGIHAVACQNWQVCFNSSPNTHLRPQEIEKFVGTIYKKTSTADGVDEAGVDLFTAVCCFYDVEQ